jgi:hypothetical protein
MGRKVFGMRLCNHEIDAGRLYFLSPRIRYAVVDDQVMHGL